MAIKPKQTISKKFKNAEWVKQNLMYYRQEARPIVDEKKATSRYNVAYGIMNEGEYLYITNPKNTNRRELMGYPSKLRNIPIGPPIFSVLMGEKTKRFIDYQVIAVNSDVENLKIAKETELVLNNLKNDFYNQLQGQESELVRTPEQIKQEVSGIIDDMAIMGQDAVDYMRFYNDLDRKFKELFFDVLCQNCYVTYRDIRDDEVIFDVIAPSEISIVGSRNMQFIEDAEAVVRKTRMSVSEIYDAFQHFKNFEKDLKPELEKDFENSSNGDLMTPTRQTGFTDIDINFSNFGSRDAASSLFENLGLNRRGKDFENGEFYDVEHIVWDSMVKVGVRPRFDPMYGIVEEEVSEDYIPIDGEEVIWEWRKEAWHGYLINNEYAIGGEPMSYTRAPKNSYNSAKKCYNGRILDGISTADLVLPYQAKHNVINYYIEKMIGKHRGDIIMFPASLMPDGNNEARIDWETSLYYADADGIMIVDDSSKEKLQALQYMKVLDSSLDKTIGQMIAYAQSNKAELEEIIGINRFRKGQNNSSDGKFVSQQAEYRGSMMSEHLFTMIDEGHQKDLSYMLDLSQIAWINGKQSHFLSSEFKTKMININPERYSLVQFGVGINNSSRGTEKLNLMKTYAQALAQDPNVPKNVIPRIIDADNMASLIREMDKLMAEHEQKQMALSEQERLIQKEEQMAELEKVERELAFKYYKTDSDNNTKLNISENGIQAPVDSTDYAGNDLKSAEIQVKKNIEMQKASLAKDIAILKANTEKYKADMAYKVAKENTRKSG